MQTSTMRIPYNHRIVRHPSWIMHCVGQNDHRYLPYTDSGICRDPLAVYSFWHSDQRVCDERAHDPVLNVSVDFNVCDWPGGGCHSHPDSILGAGWTVDPRHAAFSELVDYTCSGRCDFGGSCFQVRAQGWHGPVRSASNSATPSRTNGWDGVLSELWNPESCHQRVLRQMWRKTVSSCKTAISPDGELAEKRLRGLKDRIKTEEK